VGKSAAAINPGKLDWLNSQYIRKANVDDLARWVCPFIEAKGYTIRDFNRLRKVVLSLRERAKTLVEMADLSEFYFSGEVIYDEGAAKKFLGKETVPMFEQVIHALQKEDVPDQGSCHRLIHQLAEIRGEPLVKIAQPIRVALTGRTVSPPIDEVMATLGREEVMQRLQRAMEYIKKN
jgi:glutamyl-tRNA synthetase